MKTLKYPIWQYAIAIPIFLIITTLFFSEEVIDGKTLPRTDITQFQGMSHQTQAYLKKTGEQALWNDAMFSGFPNYLIQGFDDLPLKWMSRVTQFFLVYDGAAQALIMFMFCAWLMLVVFGLHPLIAILGAVGYAMNSYNMATIEAGHNTKMWAEAYACLVLAGVYLVFDKKYLIGFALATLGTAMELSANHFQITFYLLLVCVVWGLGHVFYAYKKGDLGSLGKQLAVLALGALLGASTQTARIWTTFEYSTYSIRGPQLLSSVDGATPAKSSGLDKDYAFSWSQGKFETFTMLIPYLYGGSSHEKPLADGAFVSELEKVAGKQKVDQMLKSNQLLVPLYHGTQPFTSGPVYAGAIMCFLFVLALLVLSPEQRNWMVGAVVLTMFLAWGKNLSFFNYFLFDYIPGFNKFRSVSMALTLTMLVMMVAAGLGLQKFFELSTEEAKKKLITAVGVVGGLSLFFVVAAGMVGVSSQGDANFMGRLFGGNNQLVDTFVRALEDDRTSLIRSDAIRSLVFILLGGGSLYLFLIGKIKKEVALSLLIVFVLADQWTVGRRYLYGEKFVKAGKSKERRKTAADKFIIEQSGEHDRVLNFQNPFQESGTSYFHPSIGGYFAAKMRRYQDVVERKMSTEMNQFITGLRSGQQPFDQIPVMNMFNAKFLKIGDKATDVIVNPNAMGNAWFVSSLQKVNTADEEMALLGTVDHSKVALIDVSDPLNAVDAYEFEVDSLDEIKIASRTMRRHKYEYTSKNGGFIVFSENHYPIGWEVKIDGKPVEMKRVNYLLRGVPVAAGKHTLTMEFHPVSYTTGNTITMISSWLVFVIVLGAFGFQGFKLSQKQEE